MALTDTWCCWARLQTVLPAWTRTVLALAWAPPISKAAALKEPSKMDLVKALIMYHSITRICMYLTYKFQYRKVRLPGGCGPITNFNGLMTKMSVVTNT
ncbi:hypothetical protein LZY01_13620 [Levilactobacillus zymae]|uniref:Secreted protein n=1 Tax=Levilactobacillus zymae TaxID=267363 RepID=A0ABQ0WWE0_9LACO|nr:hypothetical protein LZY01_13620 [Levilactobacillus zymae]